MTTTSTRQSLSGWAAIALTALLAAVLSACGGGSSSSSSESESPASRIEVGPQGALLAGSGATRSLTAQLFDAAGTPVSGSVVWSSSDPAIVTVDTNGTLRAVAAVGTARITAAVGALQSTAALVTVAQPTAGARLLADREIVSGPTPVNAAAEPAAGNAYEVVLRGVPALAVGTIVIASESANVAGRVLSVQPEGADQRVQLLSVPPNQLFTAFDFRDSVDLAQGPFEIPADLAASYDVAQTGSTFVFTPKRVTPSSSGRMHRSAATGTRALPPLPPFKECEATTGFGSGLPLPLALSAPPSFQVTLDGAVVRTADASGTRIVVTGSPLFKFTSVLQITSAFEAKIGCKLTLVKRKFRAPGWAGLFFGGDVEFGVGFEVGGKVTLASATVGGTAELKPTLTATLDCPVNTNCGLTGNVTAVTDVKPVFTTPSIEQLSVEPGVSLFAFLALEAGNADIEPLQFKAIEIKAGVDLTAKLTPEVLQIANADPILGRSQYSLAFKGDIGPGIKLGEFLTFAGLSDVVPLKLGFEVPLGASPTAASVVADQASYLPGQRATVTVKLAPASVRFPSGLIYNVKTVQLRRSTGLLITELLAEQTAADGQTDFVLGFDSPGLLNASDIVAFVDTRVLAFLPLVLEIGSAASMRINAVLPAQIATSASLDVTVEVPAANGQFAPAPNMLVDFTPTCATVNPSSGRTNASGVISTTVTPNAGCSSVSVDAVARADVGTTPLAQKTVTASVASNVVRITAVLPALISTSASLDVTVEVSAANGQFAPAPNTLVDFTPTCATINPTSGRTNASGVISTTVTPNSGCSSVSVDSVARADVGTITLAQQTVTASVASNVFVGRYFAQGQEPRIDPAIFQTVCTPPPAGSPSAAPYLRFHRGVNDSPQWTVDVNETTNPGTLRLSFTYPVAPSFAASIEVTTQRVTGSDRITFDGTTNGLRSVGTLFQNPGPVLTVAIAGTGLPTAGCFPYISGGAGPGDPFILGPRANGLPTTEWSFSAVQVR